MISRMWGNVSSLFKSKPVEYMQYDNPRLKEALKSIFIRFPDELALIKLHEYSPLISLPYNDELYKLLKPLFKNCVEGYDFKEGDNTGYLNHILLQDRREPLTNLFILMQDIKQELANEIKDSLLKNTYISDDPINIITELTVNERPKMKK